MIFFVHSNSLLPTMDNNHKMRKSCKLASYCYNSKIQIKYEKVRHMKQPMVITIQNNYKLNINNSLCISLRKT